MSEPQPMIGDGKWHVSIESGSDYLWVGPNMGCLYFDRGNHFVSPPNLVERLFGVTFDSKIERAVQKCRKYCDRQNALKRASEEKVAEWKSRVIS